MEIKNIININPVINLSNYSEFTLIELGQPIFKVFMNKSSIYFIYLLQDRFIHNNEHKILIHEEFISVTSVSNLLDLINNKTSIYSALNLSNNKCRMGSIGNKEFHTIDVVDISDISNRIPQKDVFLNLDAKTKIEIIKKIYQIKGIKRRTNPITTNQRS